MDFQLSFLLFVQLTIEALCKKMGTRKNNSIQLLRILAIFGVICIHTGPYENQKIFSEDWHTFGQIFLTIAHCAVPFFFIAAGYFFTQKTENKKELIAYWARYTKRILFLYAAWTIIYIFLHGNWLETLTANNGIKTYYWNTVAYAKRLIEDPLTFILRGSSEPLWFLFSLTYSITLLVACRKFVKNSKVLIYFMFFLAASSYLAGMFLGAYGDTRFGPTTPLSIEKLGPLVAPLFVISGYAIKLHEDNLKKYWASLLVVGLVLIFCESSFSSFLKEVDYKATSYTLGTFLFSTGLFLLCVSHPTFTSSQIVNVLGAFTLGIYLTHILILQNTQTLRYISHNPLWEFIFPTLIMGASIALTFIFKNVKLLRKLVS